MEKKGLQRWRAAGWGLSSALGLSVWVFFGIFYRHHLHYQEQLQLFLTGSEYFQELLARPGGLAIYIGRFLTQFYQDAIQGAFILALLLVSIQRLVTDAANFVARKPLFWPLCCLPSVIFFAALGDESVLLSGPVALSMALLGVAGYNRLRRFEVRMGYVWLLTLVLYWLVGMASVVFPVLCLGTEWMKAGSDGKRGGRTALFVWSAGGVLLWILSPLMAKALVLQYPLSRFWWAGDYYRFVTLRPVVFPAIFCFTVSVPLLFRWLPERMAEKKRPVVFGIGCLLVAVFGYWNVRSSVDWGKEEVMAYDYYARMQKWNSILAMADKKGPTGPLTVAILNLALSQKGLLPEHMFDYFQNGPEGLLPAFERNFTLPLMAGEIYYRLGLINTAQRFAFEGMESIPDNPKSVRCLKRLAETNLINGQYEVAEKYLRLLERTFFYRKWARQTLTYLGDEERIDAHPEWGKLRRFRPEEDFLFSEREKDMILGMLFSRNANNRMAYDYLLAYTLLTKDLPRFVSYYRLGGPLREGERLPKSYQEALLYAWSLSDPDPLRTVPYPVSDGVKQRLAGYQRIYIGQADAEKRLRDAYGDTYWYYLHYRRN